MNGDELIQLTKRDFLNFMYSMVLLGTLLGMSLGVVGMIMLMSV